MLASVASVLLDLHAEDENLYPFTQHRQPRRRRRLLSAEEYAERRIRLAARLALHWERKRAFGAKYSQRWFELN